MVTMAEYRETVQDKIDWTVIIDEMIRGSFLFSILPFDDTVTNNGQSSFTYGYSRKIKESGASFRSVGGQYTDSEAATKRFYADVAILGGTYNLDRAIAHASKKGFISQVAFQNSEKVKSVISTFHNAVINGDVDSSDTSLNGFDGLAKILSDATETEQVVTANADLSTVANVEANALQLVDDFEVVISKMSRTPDVILCNKDAKRRIAAVGRKLGQYQMTVNDFGQKVESYAGIPIMDLGDKVGGGMVIPTADAGTTDVYFLCLGGSDFHAITLDNQMFDIVLPQFGTIADTQLSGLVEMYAGVCLKSTKGAAVLEGLKVAEAKSEG